MVVRFDLDGEGAKIRSSKREIQVWIGQNEYGGKVSIFVSESSDGSPVRFDRVEDCWKELKKRKVSKADRTKMTRWLSQRLRPWTRKRRKASGRDVSYESDTEVGK